MLSEKGIVGTICFSLDIPKEVGRDELLLVLKEQPLLTAQPVFHPLNYYEIEGITKEYFTQSEPTTDIISVYQEYDIEFSETLDSSGGQDR